MKYKKERKASIIIIITDYHAFIFFCLAAHTGGILNMTQQGNKNSNGRENSNRSRGQDVLLMLGSFDFGSLV